MLCSEPNAAAGDAISPGREAGGWRHLFCGVERCVPIAGGREAVYANLDNAASTPPLRAVRDTVHELADWYSSVHRGTGYKSLLSTALYEEARHRVAGFVGADTHRDSVVFVKSTTEAINHVAGALSRRKSGLVLTTGMEHHANLLPWRHRLSTIVSPLDSEGRLDLGAMEETLSRYLGRVRLVAVSGASNVTGLVNPIHDIAAMAHRYGALVLVDAAQLAPHRRIDMRAWDDAGHIDFLAFSGHKMYAPYGTGVLVGPADFFDAQPEVLGGGAVDLVTDHETLWSAMPDREEAGSPNVLGAIALSVAMDEIERMGYESVEAHELGLAQAVAEEVRRVPGVSILGPDWSSLSGERLGLLSLTVSDIPSALVSAALSWEWGIGVRHGCFCAHPYLLRLLHVDDDCVTQVREAAVRQEARPRPGAVRVSFAPYNTPEEADALVRALRSIALEGPREEYAVDSHGNFAPVHGWPAVPSISAFVPA
jgi:selenocysteine lyase/cysteine desulfurase